MRASSSSRRFGGSSPQVAAHAATSDGQDVFVRPHEIGIARENGGRHSLAAIVVHIGFAGSTMKVELRVGERTVDVELPEPEYRHLALRVTERVVVYLRDRQVAGPSAEYRLVVGR
jgi:hypothetical protein